MGSQLAEHAIENRRLWNAMAADWEEAGERHWNRTEAVWGGWNVPSDDRVTLFPQSFAGLNCVELGCGTGYVSRWMEQRGAAKVVGVDLSIGQLGTARRLRGEHGSTIALVNATAEQVPLADGTFDVAVSEYGAAIWCEPRAWLTEARRLLRPGGWLAFLGHHPLAMMCFPQDGTAAIARTLQRPYFDMKRFDWREAIEDPGGIEFNLPISEWMRLFVDCGFELVEYVEVRVPEGDADERRFGVDRGWATAFPSEQIWKLRRR
jgi:SAM-dependent methyltransferase